HDAHVAIDHRAAAGPGEIHGRQRRWHGFIEMDGKRMTRLVLSATGKEKLKFNSARGKDENELASLPGGHRIDMACDVRFGFLGEPAGPDKLGDKEPEEREKELRAYREKAQENLTAFLQGL